MSIEKVNELMKEMRSQRSAFHENMIAENIKKLMPHVDNWEIDTARANIDNNKWPEDIIYPIKEINQPSTLDCNYLLHRFNQVISDRGLHAVRSNKETRSCAFYIKTAK